MLLIVAVAFAAMSCGNKCEKKCCQEAEAAEAVEVVEADSTAVEAEAEVEAPAEEAAAEAAE